jgi:hypothetical protein
MKESYEREDSNNERFMFLFSVVGMSPTLLNSQNNASNSQSVCILTQSGHISNGICSYDVVQIANQCYKHSSPNDHTAPVQYFDEYYNASDHIIFYVPDARLKALNGANINSNNATGVKSTIFSSIYNPQYAVPENFWSIHYCLKNGYGHLANEQPNCKVQSGQNAQVTLSASVSAGASACGGSLSASAGVSYTYDINDFCYNQIMGYDQWQFVSHVAGQTYAHFVTLISVFYKPGYRQAISFSSTGNTTWIKSSPELWWTNHCLENSSVQLTNCYLSLVLN